MSLMHCIYASAASPELASPELRNILTVSRRNNEGLGITGILLYVEGSFFQVIEGESDIIQALYERIARDPRHTQITQIICEPIAKRHFDRWAMGFSTMTVKELIRIAEPSGPLGEHPLLHLSEGRAKKLLRFQRRPLAYTAGQSAARTERGSAGRTRTVVA